MADYAYNFLKDRPQATGAARLRWPFWSEGDTTTIQIEQDYLQPISTYRPPALSTPIVLSDLLLAGQSLPSNAASSIFLEDTEPSPGPNGLYRFTRTWGTVPLTRSTPIQYAVPVPGVSVNSGWRWNFFPSAGYVGTPRPIVDEKAYGLFYLRVYVYNIYGGVQSYSEYATIDQRRTATVSTVSPLAVTADNNYIPANVYTSSERISYSFIGWTSAALPKRAERNFLCGCVMVSEYATGSNQEVLPVISPLTITSSTQEIVTTLDGTTNPSVSEWLAAKNGGGRYPVDFSFTRRYRGPIWERQTIYAPYL